MYSNLSWKILWNGHDCGKNLGNVDLEPSIPYIHPSIKKQLANVKYFNYLGSLMALQDIFGETWTVKKQDGYNLRVFMQGDSG